MFVHSIYGVNKVICRSYCCHEMMTGCCNGKNSRNQSIMDTISGRRRPQGIKGRREVPSYAITPSEIERYNTICIEIVGGFWLKNQQRRKRHPYLVISLMSVTMIHSILNSPT